MNFCTGTYKSSDVFLAYKYNFWHPEKNTCMSTLLYSTSWWMKTKIFFLNCDTIWRYRSRTIFNFDYTFLNTWCILLSHDVLFSHMITLLSHDVFSVNDMHKLLYCGYYIPIKKNYQSSFLFHFKNEQKNMIYMYMHLNTAFQKYFAIWYINQ